MPFGEKMMVQRRTANYDCQVNMFSVSGDRRNFQEDVFPVYRLLTKVAEKLSRSGIVDVCFYIDDFHIVKEILKVRHSGPVDALYCIVGNKQVCRTRMSEGSQGGPSITPTKRRGCNAQNTFIPFQESIRREALHQYTKSHNFDGCDENK